MSSATAGRTFWDQKACPLEVSGRFDFDLAIVAVFGPPRPTLSGG